MAEMKPNERFEAVFKGETPDYIPISLFGGIFETRFTGISINEFGKDPEKMAKATMTFYEQIGGDTMYLLSDMCLLPQAFGNKPGWSTEDLVHITLGDFAINELEDWDKLEPKDPMKDGRMYMYPKTCEIISKKYPDVPIGISLPSPLTCATLVCPMDQLLMWLIEEPETIKKGLKVLTKTVIDWVNVSEDYGATFSGYLTTRASREITTEDQYREFGMPYDLEVMKNTNMPHIAHICGVEPMFNVIAEYPKDKCVGISWWDRGAKINLKQAKAEYGDRFTLMAGIDHTTTLATGTPEQVDAEIKDAIETAAKGGKRMIVGPGCEIAPQTPFENMKAAIKAARKYGKMR